MMDLSGVTNAIMQVANSIRNFGVGLFAPIANPTFTGKVTIPGTTTNDSASAGIVGEYVTAQLVSGSAVSLTPATPANVTSISLTAGDWDVTSVVDYTLTGATTTAIKGSVSTTSATFGAQDTFVSQSIIFTILTGTYGYTAPTTRISLAAITTVYLVAQVAFSAGAVAAYGTIRARRVR